ncbi:MAG TPA: tRNA (adenosine(37)-N6)-threonylcarbamoyltransferase complex ATPase subunit type 1 TsaE [Nocardioidaceae bacterium]|nr:tRNA (adenosine(37)-N6)-threonylcarbamoyltransferase complex ATPase subunit type 1 TsaE [Nocardioidaceae bacterium]
MTLTLEAIGPDSAADVVALIHAAFGARPALDPPSTALDETAESVASALADHGGVLARLDGRPVGSLILEPHDDRLGRQLGLRRVAVHPDAQGAGVAKALAHFAERLAAERGWSGVRLAARTELPATVRFWEHLGYGELEHHGTSVTMGKELPFSVPAVTAEDTRDLGLRIAKLLRGGDLLILSGDLGAGKTTFTQGLGEGLGVRGDITSPTFVIARVHPPLSGGPALVHVDAYRLGDTAELDDLDLDASLDDAVTVVEWGTGLAEALTEDRLEVRILRETGADAGESRTLELNPVGARWVGSGLAALA